MKRLLSLAILVTCAGYTATAQDLAYKIPEKAFTVLSVKSNQLFQQYPVNEFNNSVLGKKLLGELSKSTDADYKSIEDLGINLSANVYYYYQATDSISKHGLIIPLADSKKVDALFSKKADSIRKVNGVNILQKPAQRTVIAWNEQFLYITYGTLSTSFLADSANAARHGVNPYSYETSYYYGDDATNVTVDTVTALQLEDMAATAVDTVVTAEAVPVDTSAYPEVVMEGAPVADSVEPPPPPPAFAGDEVPAEEQQRREEQNRAFDSLAVAWLTTSTQQLFEKRSTEPSILNDPSFIRSADNDAIATFWMAKLQNLYGPLMPYVGSFKYAGLLKGYGNINARLYMEKERLRLTTEMGLEEEKADIYKKICDHKINKKFLQYIKSDSLIAFMSYAFNTEAYMNEMPKLIMHAYGSRYDEEMALAADLLSVMLDEKAVAKVIKGDALFLLTNLSQKQVSYSSYNYNEETFEYKDTVMTKTETLPDFLFMLSSDDTQLIEKLLTYGIRKGVITFDGSIYSIAQKGKNPFAMYVLIKDGILFLGTSLQDITQIRNGSFKGNLDKQQKELMTKNNLAMFFSPKSFGAKMPSGELEKSNEKISKLLNGAGNVYITSAGIKDGYISGDMTMDVPKGEENGLKYFLRLIEDMGNLK